MDSRLLDLVIKWEECRERGEDCTASQLAPNEPLLAAELQRQIGLLGQLPESPVATAKCEGVTAVDDAMRQLPIDGAEGPPRFQATRFHARGGLGKVYLGRDRQLGREIALKEIREEYAQSREANARFIREAVI